MRFWLYKCNVVSNSSGASGDWRGVFEHHGPVRWPGHRASAAAEVHRALDERMSVGDVIMAHQTDQRALIGFCRVEELVGPAGDLDLMLQPIYRLAEPFRIHDARRNTALERCPALMGRVTLREVSAEDAATIVALANAPKRVLKGRTSPGGWVP